MRDRKRTSTMPIIAVMVGLPLAIVGFDLVSRSQPATPDEIRTQIAATPPSCREETRAVIRARIIQKGRVTAPSLAAIRREACGAMGDQLRATSG